MNEGLLAASAEPATAAAARYERAVIEAAIADACNRVAPLWPLKHFVAVNPFLGFSGQTFHSTAATMHRVARVDMLMPRSFYRQAVASGYVAEGDLEAACAWAPARWNAPRTVAAFRAALARNATAKTKHAAHVPTVTEVLDSLSGGDRIASGTAFMTDEISKWCAAYFDQGQSVWRLPGRGLRPYTAWRSAMRFDRNPEVMGVAGFRAIVAGLPDDPVDAIAEVVRRQGVPKRALGDYLHQAFVDVGGWAAYARYLQWTNALHGQADETLSDLLAIRIAWGYALFAQHGDDAFAQAWGRAMQEVALPPVDERIGDDPELAVDIVAHEAYEFAYRRRLLAQLQRGPQSAQSQGRPAVQAAFCIDVRSEVYRRAFEAESPDVATLGFAGFFGFPIEYVPIGHRSGGAQCPVLLTPTYTVCESVQGASPGEEAKVLDLRLLRRRVAKAWKSFKTAAVSSFIFVETAGVLFAWKIVSDSLALTRPVHDPDVDGLDESVIDRLGPRVEPGTLAGRRTGFDDVQAVDQAEAVLRGMSLTTGFAPLVLMTGHGSTTVNNPYASGLDCGACGGYTGEANARVAAAILNERRTRDGLRERGIDIPADTWFVGCLHDTTTDEIRMYDADAAPASHRARLDDVRAVLARAGARARRERAPLLRIDAGRNVDRLVKARSRDWSQVRPEWGLAGNAAFIAAPRSRTRGIDFGGRAFLHDYDWRSDAGFGVLELVMTAPMVVASWINLQYYGSTVNNRVFGSGNKVLHNVAGIIGVLEGNAGDLKVGLPLQSVHDGERLIHEPLRLSVFIEAPHDAIDAVIAKHGGVRDLVENHWLHLFAIGDDGTIARRGEAGAWRAVD
jgi:uncharacterized protein YbcC (UPF0753/DUF2309 family)